MSKNKKILIIDDDELYAKAFSARLKKHGFEISIQTKNLENTVALIQEESIDLVLLDLVMPLVNGKNLLKDIRSKYQRNSLPVLVVTGIDDSNDIAETFELGANDYITKPISVDVAAARINAHISQCHLDREFIRIKELEVFNAMITTYHHEINNPLSIIVGEFNRMKQKEPDIFRSLEKSNSAVERICDVMKKINTAGDMTQVFFDTYVENAEMVKIK